MPATPPPIITAKAFFVASLANLKNTYILQRSLLTTLVSIAIFEFGTENKLLPEIDFAQEN